MIKPGGRKGKGMKRKHRRVITTWFLSYMAVLLLSAAVILAVYTLMSRSIMEQITRINREMLFKAKGEIESNLGKMENLAMEIAMDPMIVELAYHDREEIYNRVSAVRTIVSDLKRSNAAAPEIINIAIYLNKPGLEISPQGMDTEESKLTDSSIISINHPILPENDKRGIGYIHISMDNRYLTRYLTGMEELTKGAVFLCGSDFSPLLPDTSISPAFLSHGNSMEDTGPEQAEKFPMKIRGDNGRCIMDSLELGKGNLRLLSIVPLKVYLGPLIFIRRAATALVIFMIAAGALLSLLLTRRNYKPLKELLQQIVRRERGNRKGATESENEYSFISDSISSVYNEKEELLSTIQSQGREMKNGYLTALLRGRNPRGRASSPLRELLGIPPEFPFHRLCLLDFEDSSGENALLLPYLAQREAGAFAGEEGISVEPVEIDGRAVFLFIFQDRNSNEKALSQILALHDQLKRNQGISATCVIGGPGRGKKDLPERYRECLEGLEYRYIYGPGSVIYADRIPSGAPSRLDLGETEAELLRAIRSGNPGEAENILDYIFNGTGNTDSPGESDLQWSKYLVYNTVGVIMKAAGIPSSGEEQSMEDLVRAGEEIFKLKSFPEVRLSLIKMAETACSSFASKKKSHNTELNNRVITYLEEHLKEINLCHTMIADNFNMNPKYLSRFFREQNGVNLTDYINGRRLEEAKELLRRGVTVKEISGQVGYGHIVTFIRVFKKMEGMTPGKYREQCLDPLAQR